MPHRYRKIIGAAAIVICAIALGYPLMRKNAVLAGLPGEESFAVAINGGAITTGTRQVTLEMSGGQDTASVLVSEDPDFLNTTIFAYDPALGKNASPYALSKELGPKTVYAKFCTDRGQCSDAKTATIILYEEAPVPTPTAQQNLNGPESRGSIYELSRMFANWGPQPAGSPSDLTGDGMVDIFDFNLLMVDWKI